MRWEGTANAVLYQRLTQGALINWEGQVASLEKQVRTFRLGSILQFFSGAAVGGWGVEAKAWPETNDSMKEDMQLFEDQYPPNYLFEMG